MTFVWKKKKKKKKEKTSKFVDAGSNSWNEMTANNMEWIEVIKEKKNETLGTERSEDIDTLYINK